jgi:hypothetical protein
MGGRPPRGKWCALPAGRALAYRHGMAMDSEMNEAEVLRVELDVLRRDHRELDERIASLEAEGSRDLLSIRRLKKQKLALKDRIALIEDRLLPDIIA